MRPARALSPVHVPLASASSGVLRGRLDSDHSACALHQEVAFERGMEGEVERRVVRMRGEGEGVICRRMGEDDAHWAIRTVDGHIEPSTCTSVCLRKGTDVRTQSPGSCKFRSVSYTIDVAACNHATYPLVVYSRALVLSGPLSLCRPTSAERGPLLVSRSSDWKALKYPLIRPLAECADTVSATTDCWMVTFAYTTGKLAVDVRQRR